MFGQPIFSRSADCLAEREGFEPPIPVKVCPLSRRIVSTTHAPLRAVKIRGLLIILSGAARDQELRACHENITAPSE
jgi:hypothetical protein